MTIRMKAMLIGIALSILLSLSMVATAPSTSPAAPTVGIIKQQQIQDTATIRRLAFIKQFKVDDDRAREILTQAQIYATRYKIDLDRFLALMAVESGFHQYVVSNANAVGLTQYIEKWHPDSIQLAQSELGYHDKFDIRFNIFVGAHVITKFKKQYGKRWMQAYNGALNDPTWEYTHRINRRYKELKGIKV